MSIEVDEIDITNTKIVKSSVKESFEVRYVALLENNDAEAEAWYYFLKYDGNEETLVHLSNQLSKIQFTLEENLSTFDLDLDHFVCARTAKEITLLDVNYHSLHRKFDGTLQLIDLKLKEPDGKKKTNRYNIKRCTKILGYGQIDKYITNEDIELDDEDDDDEDDDDDDDDDEDDDDEDDDDEDDDDDDDDDEDDDDDDDKKDKIKGNDLKVIKLPSNILKIKTKK